ncbi:hypothetical protein J6590_019133 [Homalodisca vitripennis]|nr:hypothetical protein J6590_019133 [Homalodisca vitripennis]
MVHIVDDQGTDGERKEETWILAYLKFAGVTTSMLPRPGWLWGEAPEITARQHSSTQLCAGTGQVSSFLSPTVFIIISLPSDSERERGLLRSCKPLSGVQQRDSNSNSVRAHSVIRLSLMKVQLPVALYLLNQEIAESDE